MNIFNIKFLIILIFISGILQMDILNIKWEYLKLSSVIHAFSAILLSILYIIPFVNKHAYKYIVIKKVNSKIGWFLGFILLLCILSGFYLFFIGNRGGDILGTYSFYIHLYGSFVLLLFLFMHIKNPKAKAVSIILSLSFLTPNTSYAYKTELVGFTLETKDTIYHNSDWTNSTKCKSCHTEIFNQWADSNHRNLVDSNPYYMVMESLAGEVEGEEFKQWCMSCHNPSAVTRKFKSSSHFMNENSLANTLFDKKAKTFTDNFAKHGASRLEEGVSCVACHRITEATSKGNASFKLEVASREKYPFEDDESTLGSYLGEKFINAKPEVHKKSYSNSLYQESKYCASCHDETSPITGKLIVSTFKQWENSPYNNNKDESKNRSCIDCHMTNLSEGKFSPLKGTSTKGGAIKDDVKVHYFTGSNHFLSGLKSKKHEDQTIQLLKTAAVLDLDIKDNKLQVGVTNEGAGHHLPTGVADFRELWLDVTVKDSFGKVVFTSGKLNDNGDLEKDTRAFMKVFGDKDGNEVGLLFWRYETLLKDTRIPAKQRRVESYNLKDNLSYPLDVEVKLNFRIYPQWVTNIVQKAYPALPSPNIIELEKVNKIFKR